MSAALLVTSQQITRPANTTAYTAKDAMGISLAVSDATNATPIVVTTGTNDLSDGDYVTIASVGGNTAANGNFYVDALTTTTFALYSDATLQTPVAGNGAYTSGGTVARLLRFARAGKWAGGGGRIVKALFTTDKKDYDGSVKLHLYKAPITAILDNAANTWLYANVDNWIGSVTLAAAASEDGTSSTGAFSEQVYGGADLPKDFVLGATNDLWGVLEDLGGKTPASGQKFTIKLTIETRDF